MYRIFFAIVFFAFSLPRSYAEGPKSDNIGGQCDGNLYEKYVVYREKVLSSRLNETDVIGLLSVSRGVIEDLNRYLEVLRMQEANIKRVSEYYYRRSVGGGDLFLKLESFDSNLTRAHVRFELKKGVCRIKYVSTENKSMEKYIDSEGDFVVVEE